MKTIYMLTPFQAEELKAIQSKISYNATVALEKVQKIDEKGDILELLESIVALSEEMEDVLISK